MDLPLKLRSFLSVLPTPGTHYLADAELREAAHAEFAAAGGPLDVPRVS